MNKKIYSTTFKSIENASAMFHAIKAMGLTARMEYRPFPNGRGFGYKVAVTTAVSEETFEALRNTRKEIEPLF